jgi:FAD/FMN-containing dehydrogenase
METKIITFTNWSGQYSSKPAIYAEPESVADLSEIVLHPDRFPSPLVALGSGHSNSGCNVVHGGTAVSMKKFHFILEPSANEVSAGAGIQLYELHRFLAQRKLQLPFTPEIGNATLGSVACCCLKDASLGQSSGIASGMIKRIKYVDAQGKERVMKRGDADWPLLTSSHGLWGLIYEVTLDTIPMTPVVQSYVTTNAHSPDFESTYRKTLESNDGIFGLMDASTGNIIFETRQYSPGEAGPGRLENFFNILDRNTFKYFNPVLGAIETNWYARLIRKMAMGGFGFFKSSFPKGRRTYKSLKPIDYSHQYPYRWDFHFWAFPVNQFPTVVLPAFLKFLGEYKKERPYFDEKGLMACYRLRVEKNALLSPTYTEDRMTLDPVRPVTKDQKLMKDWDDFCFAYNEFAANHGGTCTFNQTKVLSKSQVERAYGERWVSFKAARETIDPGNRFLSDYFKKLMYGA